MFFILLFVHCQGLPITQIHHLFLPGLRRQPEKAAPDKSYSENGIKERLSGEFCHSGIV
jgi:hypothetical protein